MMSVLVIGCVVLAFLVAVKGLMSNAPLQRKPDSYLVALLNQYHLEQQSTPQFFKCIADRYYNRKIHIINRELSVRYQNRQTRSIDYSTLSSYIDW